MVSSQLTPELMKEGAALIARLDAAGVPPDAALWLYSSDRGAWKLVLADAKLWPKGPREVYRAVQKALHSLRNEVTHLSLQDVSATNPDAALIKGLRKAMPTG